MALQDLSVAVDAADSDYKLSLYCERMAVVHPSSVSRPLNIYIKQVARFCAAKYTSGEQMAFPSFVA